jgi:SNF2 family DNA or RNA helicase
LESHEFERLAAIRSPLVKLNGQWVELDPQQVQTAQRFLTQQRPGGLISFLRALRIAQVHGSPAETGAAANRDERPATEGNAPALASLLSDEVAALLPVVSVDVEGWLAQALAQLNQQQHFMPLDEPPDFVGELRPYQRRGIGWLAYLRSLGIGACLADDMGLGKTVQSIALLLHMRAQQKEHTAALLICPTSVVANWRREVERFAPTLRVLVHHGGTRFMGDEFLQQTATYDLIITSYGTARRDVEFLTRLTWGDLILDEAQNIKNPTAKQTQAVLQLPAHNRIALTGTPVENRLSELWSIMEFLNPGYLEQYELFRRRYILPIERYNDEDQAAELRKVVQPFLLRRLKSDPAIIADLPEKNEMVVYCSLTQEQANLYEKVVSETLTLLDQSEGIQRRGLVLGLLTKLKQICNHPAHYLKQEGPLVGRSSKLNRLTEMLEEVLAVGDSALVFTQFVEMGELLQRHIIETFKAETLFLHGRTPANQRERMVMAFQEAEAPTIFILSLRAGGAGLNLTRANHVFHFDRWWNPAVESQATDRAFRIGQRRDVQVHKFVVAGTLEEHINQLLEDKKTLSEVVVGSGEQWLTELSTDQLRDLLLLRRDLAEDE